MRTQPLATLLSLCALMFTGCISMTPSNPLNPPDKRGMILVGPVAGANRNFHTGGFRTIEDLSCPLFSSGTGWGYSLGLTAEYIPNLTGSWSIIPRIMYENRPGQFEERLPDVAVLVSGSTTPVNQTVTVSSSVMYQLVSAELFYKQEFAQLGPVRIAVAGGPSVAYVIGGTNRQVQDLIDPPNARFLNPGELPTEIGGRRLVLFDQDIPARNDIRFSLKAGLQAEIPLFHKDWIMTPGIYYDYGITDVTSAENWQLNSLLFMVDFRHAF